MPWMDPFERNTAYEQVMALGPVAQSTVILPNALPATLAANGSWDSGLMPADGFKVVSVGITSTQGGTMNVARYIDAAGTVAQASPGTATLTAATPAVINLTDGLPFATFRITLTNGAGGTATLSNFAVLLNAA